MCVRVFVLMCIAIIDIAALITKSNELTFGVDEVRQCCHDDKDHQQGLGKLHGGNMPKSYFRCSVGVYEGRPWGCERPTVVT